MKKFDYKKLLPHLLAVVFFLILTMLYLAPLLQGKQLKQHDISTWKGGAQEALDYKQKTGETTLWTNSLFGGMPTYLISPNRDKVFSYVDRLIKVWKSEPMAQVFLYLIGFYIALLAFGVSPWLAIAGAIAYAFSTYFFIIIGAGHATKAFAIGYMPPIIAGIYLSFKDKPLFGALLMSIFLSLQIRANHFQISYYSLMVVLIFGITWLIKSYFDKNFKDLLKPFLYSVAGVLLAVGVNSTSLYLTYEYGNYSMRGQSELTHDSENQTSGLDKDYATGWSYGIDETLTLLIPNFKGGASGGSLTENSETYQLYEQAQGKIQAKKAIKQLPLYWGTQPMTSGPVYAGAIICFLFVLGLFLVKGPVKWWLLAVTVLSILLSWGKNFMILTDLFLDYFPGYNKFRTVSMTLVIAEFAIPLLGILGLAKVFDGEVDKLQFKKSMLWALGITGGLSLFFALFSGVFSFQAASDSNYPQVLVDALKVDRQMLLRNDAFRSLVFILIAAGLVWLGYAKKIRTQYVYPVLIILLLLDMWPVNKRYLNNDNFATAKAMQQEFTPTKADQFILKDKDPNFRVLNLTVSTFNDATTSYFHKSIGGYHGAKMKRYQELIDFHLFTEMQAIIKNLQQPNQTDFYGAVSGQPVLNMLNTKYIIISPENFPIYNSGALGSVWFVNSTKLVDNADQEIAALGSFNPKEEAIVDKRFATLIQPQTSEIDTTATIKLNVYKPNYLKYSSKSNTPRVAVFSEIYYPKGWNATIDGKPADYFRANYVLRAMVVPQGVHEIEWRFEPKAYKIGNTVSYASSFILLFLCLGLFIQWIQKERKGVN